MQAKIRRVVDTDYQELKRIINKHGKQWFGEEDLSLPMNYSPELCFVLETDKIIAGANLFVKLNKGIAYWSLWFVDPEYERKGFGAELNNVALTYLKKVGIKTVMGTVDKKNKTALDILTKKLKWKIMGTMKTEVWIFKEL